MNLLRVRTLVAKEVSEALRDRLYLTLAFFLPILLMLVFTYGMTSNIDNVGVVIVDEDQTAASREYTQRFLSTRHFKQVEVTHAPTRADAALAAYQARLLIWVGSGFERQLQSGQTAQVSVQIDGAFTEPARTIGGYVEAINAQANQDLRQRYAAAQWGARSALTRQVTQPVALQTRYLYNPELRSVAMIAPALMMMILMMCPPLLIAVSVVREKESGSIYNIASSTVTRFEFLLGKLIPVVGIGMVNGFMLWALVAFWFDVPFRGHALAFTLAMLLYVIATSSMGLLVSAAVKTQQAAIIITTMTAVIASMQFAGLYAPLETADPVNQFISHLFPAADFLRVIRGVYVRGAGIEVFWPEMMAMAAYGAAALALAHALFHKRTST